jgi:hypothetical protein
MPVATQPLPGYRAPVATGGFATMQSTVGRSLQARAVSWSKTLIHQSVTTPPPSPASFWRWSASSGRWWRCWRGRGYRAARPACRRPPGSAKQTCACVQRHLPLKPDLSKFWTRLLCSSGFSSKAERLFAFLPCVFGRTPAARHQIGPPRRRYGRGDRKTPLLRPRLCTGLPPRDGSGSSADCAGDQWDQAALHRKTDSAPDQAKEIER